MNKADILIFAGQSNMQGQTEGLPTENSTVENALEYRLISDTLVPLMHPVGEDIGGDLLLGSVGGCGTLVPDFCLEYSKVTGRNVIAVHTAKGATTVSEWQKGTDRYGCMVEKINRAAEKAEEVFEIGSIFFIWLQGESDAIAGTSRDRYRELLTELKNNLRADLAIDRFCIIEVGYFCATVPWTGFVESGEGLVRDEEIMAAQQDAVLRDPDFVMLTDICREISKKDEYLNPEAGGHYNNRGMSLIGRTAGKELAAIKMSGQN